MCELTNGQAGLPAIGSPSRRSAAVRAARLTRAREHGRSPRAGLDGENGVVPSPDHRQTPVSSFSSIRRWVRPPRHSRLELERPRDRAGAGVQFIDCEDFRIVDLDLRLRGPLCTTRPSAPRPYVCASKGTEVRRAAARREHRAACRYRKARCPCRSLLHCLPGEQRACLSVATVSSPTAKQIEAAPRVAAIRRPITTLKNGVWFLNEKGSSAAAAPEPT
jgi:hypothetical protein